MSEPARSPARSRRLVVGGLWLVACAATFAGWKLFWFLTDDAFIAFRYVSQRQLGHGYVWNAPPFLPVEGYSSFLWVVALDAVWTLFGVEPPDSANVLSLACSFGTLALVTAWAAARSAEPQGPSPLALLGWTLALVVTSRNFLVWSSSGLETALFNALLLSWMYLAFTVDERVARRAPLLSLVAVLLSLARPDGLLFYAATSALLSGLLGAGALPRRTALGAFAPLAGTPLHLAWRHAQYGNWLPNTYYAKIVAPWPEAGLRYLAAFTLEYALWFWLAIVAIAVFRRRGAARAALRARPLRTFARLVACAALLGQLAYYVLVVGGDHFEFRVFSQLAPLLALSFTWSAARGFGPRGAHLACAAFLVLTNVIPWTHTLQTHALHTRAQTYNLLVPVTPALVPPLTALGRPYDALQRWLIPRGVGTRHKEHQAFMRWQATLFPSRRAGLNLQPRQPNPVHVYPCVGIPAWSLPHVHVLDLFGLNDYVIARTPLPPGPRVFMAHDRLPPPGYLEAFAPNIQFDRHGKLTELVRAQPLTDDRIREIERRYRAVVDALP